MYDGKPQLSAFLRVELAADDTALLRRRTQPAAAVYRVCQAVRVIGGLRLITVNEIQLPAWRNILEHRSSEASAPLLRRQNGRPSHMGHALRRAVRVHAGNALHSPGDQSQPPVTSELITFIEEHLHAQADALR